MSDAMNVNQKTRSPLLNFTKNKMSFISVILLAAALLLILYGALSSVGGTFSHIGYIFSQFRFRFGWMWSNIVVWFWNSFVVALLWDLAYLALPAGIILWDKNDKCKLLFPLGLFVFAGLSFFGMFGSTYSFVFPSFLIGVGNVADALVTAGGFAVLGLHYLFKGEKINTLFKWIAAGAIALFHGLDYLFSMIDLIAVNIELRVSFFTVLTRWFNVSLGYLPILLVLAAVVLYDPFKKDLTVAESVE